MTGVGEPVQQRHGGEREGAVFAARFARGLALEVRHGADLARLADDAPGRWTDALLAETRIHLAGLMNAVEQALVAGLAREPVASISAMPDAGYARQAIERDIAVLSPDLLRHLRHRACVSLLMRQYRLEGRHGDRSRLESEASDNGRYLDALAGLALAERNWCGPMLLDATMLPDLPAELYHDLVWTVAALLVNGSSAQAAGADPMLTTAIARAAEGLIARHDEGQGAIAQARRCARALNSDQRFAVAPHALAEARLLLFAAIVECEGGIALDEVLEALIGPQDRDRFALLRVMGVDDPGAFQVAEMLGPVTGLAEGGDAALVAFVEGYRAFDAEQAMQWLLDRMNPRALADKLALLDGR